MKGRIASDTAPGGEDREWKSLRRLEEKRTKLSPGVGGLGILFIPKNSQEKGRERDC
jgi:hypothetical protein